MPRSNADLLALKDELTNDPQSLGLVAPPAVDDVGNADKLNEVRDTLQIDREAIPASEIAKAIDRDEYAALSERDSDWLAMVTTGGSIDPSAGSEVREGLLQLFAAGTESRANLQALLTEPANRIEHMFKAGLLEAGGTVTPSDISQARSAT